MNNRSIRAIVGMTIVGSVILTFGCAQPEQDRIADKDGEANVSVMADDSCDEANIDERVTKVKEKILDKIKKDPKLKKQFEGDPAQGIPPRFKYEVRKAATGNHVEVILEGGISGKEELKALADILRGFRKKGCLLKIILVPSGTFPLASDAPIRGFEWLACEYPMIACPNGECKSNCDSF